MIDVSVINMVLNKNLLGSHKILFRTCSGFFFNYLYYTLNISFYLNCIVYTVFINNFFFESQLIQEENKYKRRCYLYRRLVLQILQKKTIKPASQLTEITNKYYSNTYLFIYLFSNKKNNDFFINNSNFYSI